jgi:uncharacterized protein YeaO (DUF488 family)
VGRVELARVYDQVGQEPSGRFLVDRLWPRGLAKSGAPFEFWAKDVSPSNDLRKWYAHAEGRFEEFADRYRRELALPPGQAALDDLRGRIADRDVVLLTATKVLAYSHLPVLAEVLADG